jgi:EthD domain
MSYSRRQFLGRCGVPATIAAFGNASWTSLAQAAEAAGTGASISLSMTYPNSKELKFDGDYFRDKHLPLLRRVYGDSLERIELRQTPYVTHSPPKFGARPASAPPPAPIKAQVSLWIRDLPAFAAATQKSGAEVQTDFANVTDTKNVVVQYDQLVASEGIDRKSVTPRTSCICALYPGSEGAHFDTGYYVNAYMPKLQEAVGEDSIKRIEVYKGAAGQAGAKPLYLNSVHTYVKNLDAYNQKMFTAGRKLMAEGPNYTSIFPTIANLEVFAAG